MEQALLSFCTGEGTIELPSSVGEAHESRAAEGRLEDGLSQDLVEKSSAPGERRSEERPEDGPGDMIVEWELVLGETAEAGPEEGLVADGVYDALLRRISGKSRRFNNGLGGKTS